MERTHLLNQISEKVSLIEKENPILVGIDGIDGSGKTTLANELVPFLQRKFSSVIRASVDGFHHPREKRLQKGVLSPEGYYFDSFDYDFLVEKFLLPIKNLKENQTLPLAKFDWRTNSVVKQSVVEVKPTSVVLFEGVFLFRPELVSFWDYKIFVEIEFETSLLRGICRDSEILGGIKETEEKYIKRYIPGQKIYFDKVFPKNIADLIIKNDDPLNPKIL